MGSIIHEDGCWEQVAIEGRSAAPGNLLVHEVLLSSHDANLVIVRGEVRVAPRATCVMYDHGIGM